MENNENGILKNIEVSVYRAQKGNAVTLYKNIVTGRRLTFSCNELTGYTASGEMYGVRTLEDGIRSLN